MTFSSRLSLLATMAVFGLCVLGVVVGLLELRVIPEMRRESEARAEILPVLLATANQRDLVTKDLASLTRTLDQSIRNLQDAGVRYAVIQDQTGVVLAQSFPENWSTAEREGVFQSLRLMSVEPDTAAGHQQHAIVDISKLSEAERQALVGETTEKAEKKAVVFKANALPLVQRKLTRRFQLGESLLADHAQPITAGRVELGAVRVGIEEEIDGTVRGMRIAAYGVLCAAFLVMAGSGFLVANFIDRRFAIEASEKMDAQKGALEETIRKLEASNAMKEESHPITPTEFLALLDAARKMSSSLDYNEVLGIGLHSCLQILNVRDVSIFVLDPTANELVGRVGHDETGDIDPTEMAEIRIPVGHGDIGAAAEFGTTTIVDTPRPGAAAVSALVSRGRTIGVVVVRNKVSGRAFVKKDQTLIRILTGLLAVAMDTAAIVHHLGGSQQNS